MIPEPPVPSPMRKKVPRWLRNIQRNSWEPEILLSGFVLVGLLQVPDAVYRMSVFLRTEALHDNMSGIFAALQQAVYILIFGLVLHLFLRSVWVGLVGLSYAFPKGIRPGRLPFTAPYKKQVEALPTLEQQIMQLEKVCSSIFATCFFLMMMILGAIIGSTLFVSVFLGIELLLGAVSGLSIIQFIDPYLDTILLILIAVISIDFVGIGLFRRHRITAKLYYPVHRIVGWITLSRLYRPIYYLFATNVSMLWLSAFFVLFAVLTVMGLNTLTRAPDQHPLSYIGLYSRESPESLFSPYYADRNGGWSSMVLEMPSPIVQGRYLELRLKHHILYERAILRDCAGEKAGDSLKLACVNRFYRVFLDGVELEEPGWMYYFHQKERRKGFISFVDVSALEPGRHTVEIFARLEEPRYLARAIFFVE
jgi:hypothetical protein